jgi:hypothetical protein
MTERPRPVAGLLDRPHGLLDRPPLRAPKACR